MAHLDLFLELIFVLGLIFIASIKREKSSLDFYLIAYLALQCSGILLGILGGRVLGIMDSNLVQFAISQILVVTVISKMVLKDIKSERMFLWSPALLTLVFVFYSLVPVSLSDLLDLDFPSTRRTWFNYLQYGDFTTIASLIIITNVFFWLYHLILKDAHNPSEMERRFMIIFSFFLFYGGTIFILGFSRLLLEDLTLHMEFMKSYYRPVYLTSYVIITLAVRWRSIRLLF